MKDARRIGDYFYRFIGTKDWGYYIVYNNFGEEIGRCDLNEIGDVLHEEEGTV